MINWGIIGLGNMANQFANSIKEVSNTKILGISSLDLRRLKKFGEKYSIQEKYRFNSYEDILKCDEINSIYISTLNNTHSKIIMKAIDAQKNILCEKPIATNYEDTVKIFIKLKKSNVFFMEALAYMSHPQTDFILKKLNSGEIGEIKSLESSFGFLVKKIEPNSRLFNVKLGGGAILDVGCYPTSFSNLIGNINEKNKFDVPDFSNITGSIGETGVDEIAYAKLTFKNKMSAKISTAIRKNMENSTLIKGTVGNILIKEPWLPKKKSYIEIRSDKRYYKMFINSKFDIYANQIKTVNEYVLKKEKQAIFPGMSWENSMSNMFIIDKWKKELLKVKNK